jgi:glycosyltransferase involved in cell wall biosynthesis
MTRWRGVAITNGRSVALVGTYPPTACGLATYTANLRAAIASRERGWEARVLRVLDRWEPSPSSDVVGQWVSGDTTSLHTALAALSSFDAVVLQHEYGLFGGPDGDDVLDLVDGLDVPLVAILHTALREPNRNQRRILEHLLDAASIAVVHSHAARRVIVGVHGADPASVIVIPHGAAANFGGSASRGARRPTVLTWGLIGPGKGIEHGIAAVAGIRSLALPPLYVVAGPTHPKVLLAEGERYRDSLVELSQALGATDRVVFDHAYRDWDSLRRLVQSIDVVLLPYDSRDQVSSGVLVEAVASGKPIVATRFPHAEELLAGGAGILVRHGDVDAMRAALERVLYEPGVATAMAAAARDAARDLLWPAVGAAYRSLIDGVIAARAVA